MTKSNEQNILVGIDVGSTTTKIVAVDANDRHQLLFSDYNTSFFLPPPMIYLFYIHSTREKEDH